MQNAICGQEASVAFIVADNNLQRAWNGPGEMGEMPRPISQPDFGDRKFVSWVVYPFESPNTEQTGNRPVSRGLLNEAAWDKLRGFDVYTPPVLKTPHYQEMIVQLLSGNHYLGIATEIVDEWNAPAHRSAPLPSYCPYCFILSNPEISTPDTRPQTPDPKRP
ncbi:hypothetical protein SODALDRAFT_378913 [Sodiomyces alkalinus F11]|uniref:Uncharacterized protein n=1 Tax=Sodiomyces alkalinus (strain CBS 110278 / VKM F-3762 / F11) TaxID=1314773 RepID=A0A3N2PW86_SODAK|nr:hypothetical protein SODALDRAFT_378913 [Sodiomyces alkalinus F11]ROT38752.1 hypothetical protein SODALDRAFT_378913 [Sodiomyces alkalinus F11]